MTMTSLATGISSGLVKPQSSAKFDRPFALSMGPQRSATSWLDRYLRMRGDVCLPRGVKEVFFFDRYFHRGFGFYKRHYTPNSKHSLIMEISTTSFDHPEAPSRVYKIFGDQITLICPLRHPVERSYSLYLHLLRYGKVKGSLQDACRQDPRILGSSRYAAHIKRWQEYYPGDQVKILFQEDLERNQEAFLKQACEALHLPYISASEAVSDKYNVTTYSKFAPLAWAAQKAADFLRHHKLYFVINLAKKLGLKKAVFGIEKPDSAPAMMTAAERAWLQTQLGSEIAALETMIGPIPQWR